MEQVLVCPSCRQVNVAGRYRCADCMTGLGQISPVSQDEAAEGERAHQSYIRRRRRLVVGVAAAVVLSIGGWVAFENIGSARFLSEPRSDVSSVPVDGDWPMARRDPTHSAFVPGPSILPAGEVVWSFEADGPFLASPSVSGGRLFVGTGDQRLVALDSASGDVVWERDIISPVDSSPAVAGELVYFALKEGRLLALDRETGETAWEFNAGEGINSSPAVIDGVVYFGSDNRRIYALDAITGKVRWSYLTGGRVLSDPAINDEVVAITSLDGYLYLIDIETGKRRLDYIFSYFRVSPAFVDDYVYLADSRGYITAVDWRQREKPFEKVGRRIRFHFYIWGWVDTAPHQKGLAWRSRHKEDSFVATPAVDSERLYIGSKSGTFFALDRLNGEGFWTFDAGAGFRASASITGDRLFVGDLGGRLYALDTETGAEVWRLELDGPITTTPVIVGETLYVATEDGKLYAIRKPLPATDSPPVSLHQ